jgi:hypothetical protein
VAYYPAARLLVSADPPALSDDFQIVQSSMVNGFPHYVDLTKSLRLKVTLPTGLLQPWLDTDPNSLVATSDDENAPRSATLTDEIGSVARPSLRIALLQSGSYLSTLPFALDTTRAVPDDGNGAQGVAVEIALLQWNIFAGTVRGAGDFGSSIQLGWRIANLGVSDFGPPVINLFLWQRLPLTLRMESDLGLRTAVLASRFTLARMALHVV